MFKVFIKVMLFSLVVTGAYTWYSNSIPQVTSKPPEDIGDLIKPDTTSDDLVKFGKKIFFAKGQCTLCHTMGTKGDRAPDLANAGGLAGKRKAGMSPGDYLAESLYDPNTFVVDGYTPTMPAVNKNPIALSDGEILAVVAFLQSLGGKVTVDGKTKFAVAETARAKVEKPVEGPEGLMVKYQCNTCHDMKGTARLVGPPLSDIGGKKDKAYIKEAIVEPAKVIAEGYPPVMPGDYGQKVPAKEIEQMVDYLAELKSGK